MALFLTTMAATGLALAMLAGWLLWQDSPMPAIDSHQPGATPVLLATPTPLTFVVIPTRTIVGPYVRDNLDHLWDPTIVMPHGAMQ